MKKYIILLVLLMVVIFVVVVRLVERAVEADNLFSSGEYRTTVGGI